MDHLSYFPIYLKYWENDLCYGNVYAISSVDVVSFGINCSYTICTLQKFLKKGICEVKIELFLKTAFCCISLADEIRSMVIFHQQCHKKIEFVNKMLRVMEENKKEMTRARNNITALLEDYTTVSRDLHIIGNIRLILKNNDEICKFCGFWNRKGFLNFCYFHFYSWWKLRKGKENKESEFSSWSNPVSFSLCTFYIFC